MERDEIVLLRSGNETSVESAQGDLRRAWEHLRETDPDNDDQNVQGLVADLIQASELLDALVERVRDDTSLALWFTPDAIRQHFEDGPNKVCESWAEDQLEGWVAKASDADLREVGAYALASDSLYAEFHRLLVEGVDHVRASIQDEFVVGAEADSAWLEQTLGDEISNALAVIVCDPKMRAALDPAALRQARGALGLPEKMDDTPDTPFGI